MRRIFLVFAVFWMICSSFTAQAHELIVKPTSNNAEKGKKLPVELHSTHFFIIKEEVEEIPYMRAGLFKDGKIIDSPLTPNAPDLRIDFSVEIKEDRSSSLIVAEKTGMVWSVTNEGGKVGSRKDLEGQGLKVLSSTLIDKYAKAIVNASPDDKNYATATGQDLEIIPLTNPANVKVGEYFDVKILHQGQPVSVPVWATYDGFSSYGSTYAYYTEADAEGIAHIKITHPGLWVIRTVKEKDPGVQGQYDSRSLRSTFVFPVK